MARHLNGGSALRRRDAPRQPRGPLRPGRRTLQGVALVACEDTRRTARLFADQGLRRRSRPSSSTRAREGRAHPDSPAFRQRRRARVRRRNAGDLGPGYRLVRAAGSGLAVIRSRPLCVTTALSVSGLPSDRFLFVGFCRREGQRGGARSGALAGARHARALRVTVAPRGVPRGLIDCLGEREPSCVARPPSSTRSTCAPALRAARDASRARGGAGRGGAGRGGPARGGAAEEERPRTSTLASCAGTDPA